MSHPMNPGRAFALAFVLITTIGLSAEARAERVDLTNDVLDRVTSVENGVEKLRVYLSRQLVIERSTSAATEVEVDRDVDVVYRRKELKETLGRGIRGKIIAVEGTETSRGSFSELSRKLIYVTFDPACTVKECAFVFGRAVEDKSEYRRYSREYHYSRIFRSDEYHLVAAPINAEYAKTSLFSKKLLRKRPLTTRYQIQTPSNPKYGVYLQVKENELTEVIRGKRRYPGVE
jgi:hypothetical protein